MRSNLLNRTTSLGTIILGLLAAAATGCGSSDASGNKPGAEQTPLPDTVGVTQQSLSVDGCAASAVFNIVANQTISDIALDQSMLSNVQMQLFQVDDEGHQTQVNQTAQEATSDIQSQINQLTNNVNSAQSMIDQSA